jgi:hypothetical protein
MLLVQLGINCTRDVCKFGHAMAGLIVINSMSDGINSTSD